ncbi:hypothetical protein A4S05_32240 [Nostoc sp. KVJ20]|nr:hypothetical protein A4S05_32240 [Nostoc sp. KVJ20]
MNYTRIISLVKRSFFSTYLVIVDRNQKLRKDQQSIIHHKNAKILNSRYWLLILKNTGLIFGCMSAVMTFLVALLSLLTALVKLMCQIAIFLKMLGLILFI